MASGVYLCRMQANDFSDTIKDDISKVKTLFLYLILRRSYMKRLFSALIVFVPFIMHAQTAKIKIDVKESVGEIDSKIYGVFMEPIGRRGSFNTVYGNLYDPSSPLADENGFRKDYIDAMKELKITNMRWPGGNFVMGYDWKDGVGPKAKRPVLVLILHGVLSKPNQVGLNEWLALNKSIGSENIVCVNLGLGTILDACYEVEYATMRKELIGRTCVLRTDTRNPTTLKFGISVMKLTVHLGNSVIKIADEYVKIAREAAKAMRSVDHSIKFVASGFIVVWNYSGPLG